MATLTFYVDVPTDDEDEIVEYAAREAGYEDDFANNLANVVTNHIQALWAGYKTNLDLATQRATTEAEISATTITTGVAPV